MHKDAHILHVRASNFVGGPERQVLRYAAFGRGGPVQVTVASFVGIHEGKEFLAAAERMGILTLALPAGIRGAFESVSILTQYIRERRVSLLCTHGYRADIVGIRTGRKCQVPVACFLRGWTRENWKVRAYEAMDRAFFRQATRLVTLSDAEAQGLRKNPAYAGKVRTVVNAIEIADLSDDDRRRARLELRRRLGLSVNTPVVAAAGRLSPEKGAADLLQAVPAIHARCPDARFVLFGDGPLRRKLEDLTKELRQTNTVCFAGFVPDFAQLLPGVDVLVNPSLSEQMPNVVLEAMAAGVPVVATAVGGVPEICGGTGVSPVICHGQEGHATPQEALVLVPPSDAGAIGDAVVGLLSDATRAKALGLAGQRRVAEAYSPARQQAQLHALYAELVPGLKSIYHGEEGESPNTCLSASSVFSAPSVVNPFISVVIPVRNEEAHLGAVLEALLAQDYPPERFEILVVDGGSTDGTAALVKRYARAAAPRVVLLSNPARLSSAGRNVGMTASHGEIICFIDGHCSIPTRGLLRETARLFEETNADCLCRPQPLTAPGNSPLQEVIARARGTVLGHGRDSTIYAMDREGWVNPTSSGAVYRRSVFEKVGRYDDRFDACEDVEFNYRVFKVGLRAYSSPAVAVYYHPRASLRGLFQQLLRYGRGRFRFVRKHPEAISLSQLVPAAFLAWLIVGGLAACFSVMVREALLATLALYGTLVAGFSAALAVRHGWRHFFVTPVVFPTIHLALGAGWWAEVGGTILRIFAAEPQRRGGKTESTI